MSSTAQRLPNLLIAGVAKAGTTSLFRYLVQHPEICGSDVKEIGYFSTVRYGEPPRPLDEYAAHFAHCGAARYAMEATTGYYFGGAPLIKEIERVLDEPRVIVLFRDPVKKFWSYYSFQRARFVIDPDVSFDDYLDTCEKLRAEGTDHLREHNAYWALSAGFYADVVEDWLDALGDRFEIVFFEHLVARPAETVTELFDWLGLDPAPAQAIDYGAANRTVQYRSPVVRRLVRSLPGKNAEWLWQRPALRAALQRAYHVVNRDRSRELPLTDDARARLETIYQPANARLAEILRARGIGNLPGWLDGGG